MSWHRLSRLEALVGSYPHATEHYSVQDSQSGPGKDDCRAAIAISHQLKGTLGSFGFQTASLQAKHIEQLLSASSLNDAIGTALLQDQVSTLKQLLKQHMTSGSDAHQSEMNLPSMDTARVLVVSRDHDWTQTLQQYGQDGPFQIELCSPLTINDYLLEQTPSVILLELSDTERSVDLSLLDALISNYDGQVPILAVLESSQPDEQLVAIHHGASAIALKNWSIKTLLTIIGEYAYSGVNP